MCSVSVRPPHARRHRRVRTSNRDQPLYYIHQHTHTHKACGHFMSRNVLTLSMYVNAHASAVHKDYTHTPSSLGRVHRDDDIRHVRTTRSRPPPQAAGNPQATTHHTLGCPSPSLPIPVHRSHISDIIFLYNNIFEIDFQCKFYSSIPKRTPFASTQHATVERTRSDTQAFGSVGGRALPMRTVGRVIKLRQLLGCRPPWRWRLVGGGHFEWNRPAL